MYLYKATCHTELTLYTLNVETLFTVLQVVYKTSLCLHVCTVRVSLYTVVCRSIYYTFISQTFERKLCLINGTLRKGIVVRRKLLCPGSATRLYLLQAMKARLSPQRQGRVVDKVHVAGFLVKALTGDA